MENKKKVKVYSVKKDKVINVKVLKNVNKNKVEGEKKDLKKSFENIKKNKVKKKESQRVFIAPWRQAHECSWLLMSAHVR